MRELPIETAGESARPSRIGVALAARPAARGVAWMALAQLCFAAMSVLARISSQRGVRWQESACARASVGALVAFAIARSRGGSLRIRDRKASWMRSLLGTGAMLCTFYALAATHVRLGDVVTITATAPILIALLSPRLLGERVGLRGWLAIPIAFAGVAIVLRPSFDTALAVAVVASAAAAFSALAMIWLRRLGPDESSEAIVLHFSCVAAAVTFALSLPGFRAPSPLGAAAMLGAGVAGGLGQVTMTRAYSLDRAARIGAVGYLGVVLTQLLAAVVLGEAPSAGQALGSALVVGAGLLLAAGAWSEPIGE